jgi:hypothetical protein
MAGIGGTFSDSEPGSQLLTKTTVPAVRRDEAELRDANFAMRLSLIVGLPMLIGKTTVYFMTHSGGHFLRCVRVGPRRWIVQRLPKDINKTGLLLSKIDCPGTTAVILPLMSCSSVNPGGTLYSFVSSSVPYHTNSPI